MSSQVFLLAEAGQAAGGHAEKAADTGIQLGVHWTHNTPYGLVHVDTVLYTVIVMALCLLLFGLLGQAVQLRPASTKVKRASAIESIV